MKTHARAVAALVALASCGSELDPIGQSFRNASAVEQAYPAFVVVGTLGAKAWPATLLRAENGRGEISFARRDGTKHVYPGFDGYRLKALFLEDASGQETVLVLRTREK